MEYLLKIMLSFLTLLLLTAHTCSATKAENPSEFKSKVIIITGGSSGIGFTTGLLLARQGAHIGFCARDSKPHWFNGTSAGSQINSDALVQTNGGSASFFKADVRLIN